MVKFISLFIVNILFTFQSHAANGSWDFNYEQSYCSMSVSDSFLTEKQLTFVYTVSFTFLGENHVNSDKLLTRTPILFVYPQLLGDFPKEPINSTHLFINGTKVNEALTIKNFNGDDAMNILDELMSGKPVVGVAEFPNGTTVQWTFNTNDIQINGKLFKVCIGKST